MNWDVKTNVGGQVKQFRQNTLLSFCSDDVEHFLITIMRVDIHPGIDPLR